MKAISLWQPWASLWGTEAKRYETRHWSTPYRGPIAVHAAKRLEIDVADSLDGIIMEQFGCSWNETLPRGAIIAVGRLADVVRTESLGLTPRDDEYQCGDFSPGRFAWRIADYQPLARPIPWRGQQGLFEAAIERQLLEASAAIGDKVAHVRAAEQTRNHHCHWPGCTEQVPPAKWGCLRHWRRLPEHIRRAIWRTYAIGQEETGTPSREYIAAARAAQDWIAANHAELPL